jgi:hypothetical protein
MTDKIEKLRQSYADYQRKVEEIRQDWILSDAAKRVELEKVYGEARAAYEELVEEFRAGVRERLRETRKTVFSAPKLGKDDAFNMLAYRDALDRTSKMNDPHELSETLARAEITGDRALVRACLYRGYSLPGEAAKTAIVQSYFAKYPDELPAWDSFMEAATISNKLETVGISMSIGVLEPERPRELGFGGSDAA